MAIESVFFSPKWHRPPRKNDIIPPPSSTPPKPFWNQYPCLICGTHPTSTPKRCSRCKSTVYCSSICQKVDFGEGKHKSHCMAVGKLWEEKDKLEKCLWFKKKSVGHFVRGKRKSTNPFDDDYEHPNEQQHDQKQEHEYPIVGKFWYDQPETPLQKNTTQYCVVLLQLVQLLGRAESWRVSRIVSGQRETFDASSCWRSKPLNPLSLELAIDIAFTLYHLDRTDRRVRLLIPSLLLEGGYYQEAYNFIKYWTKADGCLMILDLALPGGEEDDKEHSSYEDGLDQDMFESPTVWMDGEIVYPSIGMVFEMAYLKCHLLVLPRSKKVETFSGHGSQSETEQNETLMKQATCVGEKELMQQVNLLLSLVHKWNSHLLPNLGKESYDVCFGASSRSTTAIVEKKANDNAINQPRTPPALESLLNLHPPGFELQYSFGNPGGGSIDEAASIWQRDMILWHVMNPLTMELLSQFCKDLKGSLVDTSVLTGEVNDNNESAGDDDGVTNFIGTQRMNAAEQRLEAEELVAKLQKENPDRTMDQIMMHPDMAALMIKHLHTD